MVMVASHVKMDEEDALDVAFWLAQTPSSRLAEVFRLRKNYFTWANGSFPQKMDKVISQREM